MVTVMKRSSVELWNACGTVIVMVKQKKVKRKKKAKQSDENDCFGSCGHPSRFQVEN
jgi:hypothetical protein